MSLPDWYRRALAAGSAIGGRDVLFVVGCQKSGTTWVERLLDGHPNVCCRGEGHFNDVAGPLLEHAVKLYNDEAKTSWTLDEKEIFSVVRMFTDQVLGKYLRSCPEPDAITVIGDRTPEAAVGLPALGTLYPQARFVHVIRDGRDGAVSGWAQLHRVGEADRFATFADYVAYFARYHWVPYVTRARQAGSQIPGRYLELRYEDLHTEPEVHTRRLLEFVGVDAGRDLVAACVESASFHRLSGGREQGREDAASHFRKGIVGDFRNHFDEAAGRRFEAEAGDLLRGLGYADDPAVTPA
ncbi:MAG: sulfotransferase family protein [Planctomycetota bacterium]|jgi:hypothetical protein